VPSGTKDSLVSKLNAALAALNAGDTAKACANLKAFITRRTRRRARRS